MRKVRKKRSREASLSIWMGGSTLLVHILTHKKGVCLSAWCSLLKFTGVQDCSEVYNGCTAATSSGLKGLMNMLNNRMFKALSLTLIEQMLENPCGERSEFHAVKIHLNC